MRLAVFCLALVAAALCLAGASGAAASASFADTPGDSGVAPDVTSVTVSNDDQGLISFRVTVANRPALGPDDVIAIPFATNEPGRVGLRDDGVEFIIGLDGRDGPFLQRWNGADMVPLDLRSTSVRGSFAGGVVTVTVRQEDLAPGFPNLALPSRLAFYVLGITFKGNDIVAQDEAPDANDQFWSYQLLQPSRVVVTYFRAPKTAKAGTPVVVHLGAARSDTGRPLKPMKVACRAKLGSRTLKGSGTQTDGYAICSWAVPKNNRGKTLRGSITLTSGEAVVTRSFSTLVR